MGRATKVCLGAERDFLGAGINAFAKGDCAMSALGNGWVARRADIAINGEVVCAETASLQGAGALQKALALVPGRDRMAFLT